MSAVLPQLKQANITFHRAKVESLEKKIMKFNADLDETKRVATEVNRTIGQIIEGRKGRRTIFFRYISEIQS